MVAKRTTRNSLDLREETQRWYLSLGAHDPTLARLAQQPAHRTARSTTARDSHVKRNSGESARDPEYARWGPQASE
jgi:hypothetical protein